MAQLDFVTYLYQFSWLSLTFFIFYVILLQWILPAISAALKGRTKKRILVCKDNYVLRKHIQLFAIKGSYYWDRMFKLQEKQVKIAQIQQALLRLKLATRI